MISGGIIEYLLSATGGALLATWGMLKWTNGRIRKLEMERVTPADCESRVKIIASIHQEMWADIKQIAKAVARIEGRFENEDQARRLD